MNQLEDRLSTGRLSVMEIGYDLRHYNPLVKLDLGLDTKLEREIIDKVLNKFPTDSILGEETGMTNGTSNYEWVIDPIDGTRYLNRGGKRVSINLALKYQGNIVGAWVYNPFVQEFYSFEQNANPTLEKIDNMAKVSLPIKTSETLRDMPVVYQGSRHYREDYNLLGEAYSQEKILKLEETGGSIAYNALQITKNLGAYIYHQTTPANAWDIDAALSILHASNCVVSSSNEGNRLIFAQNQSIHDELTSILNITDATYVK